jgi:hypothetical protein
VNVSSIFCVATRPKDVKAFVKGFALPDAVEARVAADAEISRCAGAVVSAELQKNSEDLELNRQCGDEGLIANGGNCYYTGVGKRRGAIKSRSRRERFRLIPNPLTQISSRRRVAI